MLHKEEKKYRWIPCRCSAAPIRFYSMLQLTALLSILPFSRLVEVSRATSWSIYLPVKRQPYFLDFHRLPTISRKERLWLLSVTWGFSWICLARFAVMVSIVHSLRDIRNTAQPYRILIGYLCRSESTIIAWPWAFFLPSLDFRYFLTVGGDTRFDLSFLVLDLKTGSPNDIFITVMS